MPPPGASVKASHSPSGDHTTKPTGSSSATTRSGNPPADGTVQICGAPLRLVTNATWRPSGEKLGDEQLPIWAMSVTLRSSSDAGSRSAHAELAVAIASVEASRRAAIPERM
jgi:hypothetical protein